MVEVWQIEEAGRCRDCGTYEWEWEENPRAWEADLHWCLGCKDIEELREKTVGSGRHIEGYKLRLYREVNDGN